MKVMIEQENIEFLQAVGKQLSETATLRRFDPKEVHAVMFNGEAYKVGPFVATKPTWDEDSMDSIYEETYAWQYNPAVDKYVLYALEEDWDSWGTHYGNFGVHFSIGEVIKYVPVIKYTNIHVDNHPKKNMEW
jgi:hypothetical protein